ncbi:TPA: hypothetical protein DCX15_02265 [bacterium]|nr:hypothetical protein [bacterium]
MGKVKELRRLEYLLKKQKKLLNKGNSMEFQEISELIELKRRCKVKISEKELIFSIIEQILAGEKKDKPEL